MELPETSVAPVPEPEAVAGIEDREMDRIAFELWQLGSLPEIAVTSEAELEEVAARASCL
jgi:hypothetical protein